MNTPATVTVGGIASRQSNNAARGGGGERDARPLRSLWSSSWACGWVSGVGDRCANAWPRIARSLSSPPPPPPPLSVPPQGGEGTRVSRRCFLLQGPEPTTGRFLSGRDKRHRSGHTQPLPLPLWKVQAHADWTSGLVGAVRARSQTLAHPSDVCSFLLCCVSWVLTPSVTFRQRTQ